MQGIERVPRERPDLHGRAGDPTGLSAVRQLKIEPEVSAATAHERLEVISLDIANDWALAFKDHKILPSPVGVYFLH